MTTGTPRPRPFRYAADPVCVGAVLLYAVNRWALKPHGVGGAFTHGYLNDVLCLPLFLPPILFAQRLLRLRRHDGRPRLWEVLQHWLVFSLVFEVVLPRYPQWFRTTADPLDVVAYLAGGLVRGRCGHRARPGADGRRNVPRRPLGLWSRAASPQPEQSRPEGHGGPEEQGQFAEL